MQGGKKMVKTNPSGVLAAAVGALVAVGLLVLMLVVVQPRPAGATFPGPNGKIAYAADDGEVPGGIDSEIYTIDPTGGMPFQVTDNDTEEGSPDYSPAGTKIAYLFFNDTATTEIYTINVGGGGKSRVTNDDTTNGAPSYSPDGKKIAYHSYDGYDFE